MWSEGGFKESKEVNVTLPAHGSTIYRDANKARGDAVQRRIVLGGLTAVWIAADLGIGRVQAAKATAKSWLMRRGRSWA